MMPMPFMYKPRCELLDSLITIALNDVVNLAEVLRQKGLVSDALVLDMRAGEAASAAAWLHELALHYKAVLDDVAHALCTLPSDVQEMPGGVADAIEALEHVQPGYLGDYLFGVASPRPGA